VRSARAAERPPSAAGRSAREGGGGPARLRPRRAVRRGWGGV